MLIFPAGACAIDRALADQSLTGTFVATTGSDANDCLSPDTTCRTLQRVHNFAPSSKIISFGNNAVHGNNNGAPTQTVSLK